MLWVLTIGGLASLVCVLVVFGRVYYNYRKRNTTVSWHTQTTVVEQFWLGQISLHHVVCQMRLFQ